MSPGKPPLEDDDPLDEALLLDDPPLEDEPLVAAPLDEDEPLADEAPDEVCAPLEPPPPVESDADALELAALDPPDAAAPEPFAPPGAPAGVDEPELPHPRTAASETPASHPATGKG